MNIDTAFLRRCILSLEVAVNEIGSPGDSVLFDMHRDACLHRFEQVLEQSGKLLRKRLADYFASNRHADRLAFRDLFRHAAKHGLMDAGAAERWLHYRDNRNDPVHDRGECFSATTLKLLPAFIDDAKALADTIEAAND